MLRNEAQLTRKDLPDSGFRASTGPGLGRGSPELASDVRPKSGRGALAVVQKPMSSRGNNVRFRWPEFSRSWAVAGTPESRPEVTPATPAVPIGPEFVGRSSYAPVPRLTREPRNAARGGIPNKWRSG